MINAESIVKANLDKKDTVPVILKVAWLSVLLGLGIEVIVLIVEAGFGKSPVVKTVIADLVQKISWATFVCVGVAVGITAGKMHPPVAGLAGFVAAPVAFYAAKSLHKGTAEALGIAASAGVVSPVVLAFIKALEYGALGFLLTEFSKRPGFGLRFHILVGLSAGIIFGGTIIALTIVKAPAPLPMVGLITRGVNEILFPIGCSLILYGANVLGRKMER